MRFFTTPFFTLLIALFLLTGCEGSLDVLEGDSSSNSSSSSSSDSGSDGTYFQTISESPTNEPFYTQHWHIEPSFNAQALYSISADADVNIESAWETSKGAGIKVAVIDSGVDTSHEDLSAAIYAQYNAYTGLGDATPLSNSHGTSVAGIISMQDNDTGGIGVAPESALIAINDGYEESPTTFLSSVISAFNYADEQGADVINNSWGTGDVADSLKTVIDDLATSGRGGKGIVIVFAAGNSGGLIGNDESSLESVIAAGATNESNERASYSNYGPELDIMAPGGENFGIFTTDISGQTGSDAGDYLEIASSGRFSGTSAAAPIVSGIAALILSVNNNLTATQVKSIITDNADKVGSIVYTDGRNDFYGYGKINAEAAVNAALAIN